MYYEFFSVTTIIYQFNLFNLSHKRNYDHLILVKINKMGFAESKSPNLEKVVSEGEVYNIKFGICEMQGWRATMV